MYKSQILRLPFVFLLLLCSTAYAQPELPPDYADSIWEVWEDKSMPDTSRLEAIHTYSWRGYVFSKPDSSYYYAQLQYDFAKKVGKKSFMGKALNTQGNALYFKDDFARAIEHYTRALSIMESIPDSMGISVSLNNIGILYIVQKDYDKAIEILNRNLTLQEILEDKRGMLSTLNNLGLVYNYTEQYDAALDCLNKALKIAEEINNQRGLSNILGNMGQSYFHLKKYDEALEYYNSCMKIQEEANNQVGIAQTLNNIGNIYQEQKKYPTALDYTLRSLSQSKELEADMVTKDAAQTLWKIYKATGKNKQALEMHELYIQMRDTIESEENKQEILRQEYKYEYEKQSAADSVKNAEKEKVKDALIQKKNTEIASRKQKEDLLKQREIILYIGLGLVILFAIFIFNRFQITNKQKKIIESQKHEVEEQKGIVEFKNKEILDSINYAKRIQTAILPPDRMVKSSLPNSFVLYKPKDIVAGDFYWLEVKGQQVLFAAADCTGHGVPGAMVSVICNNGLNRSVREFGLSDPGAILNKTREIVIQEFEKSEEEVHDGMDIALCSIENNKLQYAGAHNPLWLIKNGENQVTEIKANKQPIGKFDQPLPYTSHEVEVSQGDTLYIFSDGFADQFGGEKGKKFKSSNFKKLLLSIQQHPMEEQRSLINKAFEDWKGDLEQVDDVCVIGVRV